MVVYERGKGMFEKELGRECNGMDLALREVRAKMKVGKQALKFIKDKDMWVEFIEYGAKLRAKYVSEK